MNNVKTIYRPLDTNVPADVALKVKIEAAFPYVDMTKGEKYPYLVTFDDKGDVVGLLDKEQLFNAIGQEKTSISLLHTKDVEFREFDSVMYGKGVFLTKHIGNCPTSAFVPEPCDHGIKGVFYQINGWSGEDGMDVESMMFDKIAEVQVNYKGDVFVDWREVGMLQIQGFEDMRVLTMSLEQIYDYAKRELDTFLDEPWNPVKFN